MSTQYSEGDIERIDGNLDALFGRVSDLADRVDELEATLTEKTERIDALEAEVKRLTDELATRGQEEECQGEHAATTSENSSESESSSLLGRLFGGRSK